jgi:hypothetical protein
VLARILLRFARWPHYLRKHLGTRQVGGEAQAGPRDAGPAETTMRRRLVLAAIAALVCGASPHAHHSFGAMYLESDMIEVDGTVVEFQYKNPHAWVHVRGIERGTGQEKVYAAEWVSTSQLERQGIDKNTLKPGDKVRVWGSPSKNPAEFKMHLKRIERPSDGWQWRGNQNGGRGNDR